VAAAVLHDHEPLTIALDVDDQAHVAVQLLERAGDGLRRVAN